ncbi:hypothetical protein I553_10779 [Mycobacterium xenopi 4042]|uniref:Uncharacterized protein n=1 Tax=Mycobacterium xenopi 4042 TaxID=1299334 RepID=X8DA26_MYCXE|nr:hypothetical protein I553_10779 [Mycobacterium xenopi 4042]
MLPCTIVIPGKTIALAADAVGAIRAALIVITAAVAVKNQADRVITGVAFPRAQ